MAPDSRQLVGEDQVLPDGVLGEGVKLQREVLVIRADAGVSDKSPVRRRRIHGAVLWCRSKLLRIAIVKTRPAVGRFGLESVPKSVVN